MLQAILTWILHLFFRLLLVARARARLSVCRALKFNPEGPLFSPREANLYRRCISTLLGIFITYLLQVLIRLW
jgi:hypothetical protein